MLDEAQLLEKLKLIEALHAGAGTPGERDAAANARERILARLREVQATDRPVEFTFNLRDQWSRRLLVALLRRYGLRPYRYPRQRHTTVNARVPAQFLNGTLWPEFEELNRTLHGYLAEVTDRVIGKAIAPDASEVEVKAEPAGLGAGEAAPLTGM